MAFKEFNMRIKNLAQIFIIITLLTGCIAKSQPVSNSIESVKPIIFIKHANSGSRVTITGGKLHVDPYGCIRLGSDTSSFIIWANNSNLEYTKDGRISITNRFNNNKVSLDKYFDSIIHSS